ncbi:MAG: ATP-binding protein [Clostridiales bacterium]|jgi:predicted AAA+ superfamily ATPase|nr:ATP-binding protein [Clostridiales bacterium]
MDYKKRVIDELLDLKLESFGATLIVGPKGCGKTTSAKQKSKSVIEFQDEDLRENLLSVATNAPSKLLIGETPILFDEWQDAPKLWGAIRKSIDDERKNGLYILTGSSSKEVETPHTGTMRISRLQMYPMSLYESEESNGSVSLIQLFDNPDSFDGCVSDMSIDDVIFAICRGGWPKSLSNPTERSQLEVAKDLFRQTYLVDISNIDNVKRNRKWAQSILQSYSRNICTLATTKTIWGDVKSNFDISQSTFNDYIRALEKLYIVEDIDSWNPAIRSKTVIRSSKKRNLVDPSIAVAALGLSPKYFNRDFKTLGFLFESLCIRDLKIYSSALDGYMSYYRDRYGLEADGVLHLNDGRFALIEFKLGSSEIDDGAKHLLEIERLIKEANKLETQSPIRLPDLKIVITATQYGYRRDDGVFVVPIGCLKP